MIMLMITLISSCSKVDDNGITGDLHGVDSSDIDVSYNDLKGLLLVTCKKEGYSDYIMLRNSCLVHYIPKKMYRCYGVAQCVKE